MATSYFAVLQKYVNCLGLEHVYWLRPMRATSIATVLNSGAKLDDGQRTVRHADPATTQRYDRWHHPRLGLEVTRFGWLYPPVGSPDGHALIGKICFPPLTQGT